MQTEIAMSFWHSYQFSCILDEQCSKLFNFFFVTIIRFFFYCSPHLAGWSIHGLLIVKKISNTPFEYQNKVTKSFPAGQRVLALIRGLSPLVLHSFCLLKCCNGPMSHHLPPFCFKMALLLQID